ncbi:hypothetical protein P4E94_01795 [Pontiellaceae bacterium B12219]|nr:hypothetical protein [Pontiellaceae bacterium B12219]
MNRFFFLFFVVFTVLAYSVCLMPGPGYWEAWLAQRASAVDGSGDICGAGVVNQEHQAEPVIPRATSVDEEYKKEPQTKKEELPGSGSNEIRVDPATENLLRSILTRNLKWKERLGHFIPMIGIAFCLFCLLDDGKVSLLHRFLLVSLISTSIALSIELLQKCLPSWFCRGFAWDDIAVGASGGLFGILLGILIKLRKSI